MRDVKAVSYCYGGAKGSFVAEGDDGVGAQGAAGGDVAGEQSDGEDGGDGGEGFATVNAGGNGVHLAGTLCYD